MKNQDDLSLEGDMKEFDRELAETALLSVSAYTPFSEECRARLEERLNQADERQRKGGAQRKAPARVVSVPWKMIAAPMAAALVLAAVLFAFIDRSEPVGTIIYQQTADAAPTELYAGQEISSTSRQVLWLDNRATILQNKGATLEVLAANSLRLTKGSIYVHVKTKSGHFDVHTPGGGRVDVIGTSFLVSETADGGAEVSTYSGLVEFSGPQGMVAVMAGESATLIPGGGAPQNAEAASEPEWAKDLLREYQENALNAFFPSTVPAMP